MRWDRLRRSRNINDVRGRGPARRAGLPLGGRGGGLGFIVIIVLAALFGGPEVLNLLLGTGGGIGTSPRPTTSTQPDNLDDTASAFVASILGSTEDVWGALYQDAGRRYEPPLLTLFGGAVDSACGYASAASGPFYCPADRRVYLDTSFFDELARMGGAGDFAAAYVIGHEVGHHVQNLQGTAAQVRAAQANASRVDANQLQVAMELQADCLAGIWAHVANRQTQVLEPGDIEEGLRAAAAIGDDRLQRNAGRRVTPESFTHGSSAQRQQWLRRGLESGDPGACDTFN
jgi:predicted metalloprotease